MDVQRGDDVGEQGHVGWRSLDLVIVLGVNTKAPTSSIFEICLLMAAQIPFVQAFLTVVVVYCSCVGTMPCRPGRSSL
jgi:hypothetical protein